MDAGTCPAFLVIPNILTASNCAELLSSRFDMPSTAHPYDWHLRSPALPMLSQLILFHASLDLGFDAHSIGDWTVKSAWGSASDLFDGARTLICVVRLEREPLALSFSENGIDHYLTLGQGDAGLFAGPVRVLENATFLTTTLTRLAPADERIWLREASVRG